ncbi:hypothetical protein [Aeromicrobium fastidiosum]|uniref:Uncharacterized protein n=1 Tax=Aeromicrobium fastidiosum TaxID=52699 RepID=A0A641APV2_9ACTN|nr:hypothetical protein [Aeromicrobium fastidiosum]KAA1379712.1 hypothetical protein ESP62_000380 [Aeromicrobium fastidiosum]MBP2389197.1 hypothetical protein [Aeromicrobium fastidiosum]
MRSRALKLLIGTVVVIAVGSVAFGLAWPDGSIDDAAPVNQGPRPTTAATAAPTEPAPSASPSPSSTAAPGADLAPASVSGTWPGAPRGVVAGDGTVDWCRAVSTTGAAKAEAQRVFGTEAVDAAACAAVRFVFEHRYSRTSLPRASYAVADFDAVLPALDARTAADVYRPRIARFVADPRSDTAGEQLGLVLFTGSATRKGATHASAGAGHVFYGPAFTTDGYADRAAWINPRWTTVTVRVDRTAARPRIEARFTASASVPVWSTSARGDAMLTVPTTATFLLRPDGDTWRINGWTIGRGDVGYAPLDVR